VLLLLLVVPWLFGSLKTRCFFSVASVRKAMGTSLISMNGTPLFFPLRRIPFVLDAACPLFLLPTVFGRRVCVLLGITGQLVVMTLPLRSNR